MVIAVIAALLVSILSLVPFWVAVKRVRLINETASAGVLGPFLLTIAISFLILLAGIVLCKLIAADYQVGSFTHSDSSVERPEEETVSFP